MIVPILENPVIIGRTATVKIVEVEPGAVGVEEAGQAGMIALGSQLTLVGLGGLDLMVVQQDLQAHHVDGKTILSAHGLPYSTVAIHNL